MYCCEIRVSTSGLELEFIPPQLNALPLSYDAPLRGGRGECLVQETGKNNYNPDTSLLHCSILNTFKIPEYFKKNYPLTPCKLFKLKITTQVVKFDEF